MYLVVLVCAVRRDQANVLNSITRLHPSLMLVLTNITASSLCHVYY